MKYRVGDKVKTIRNFGAGKYSIGTIVETDNGHIKYKVHFDNSGLYLWLSESEFETVEQLPFPIGTKVKCSYYCVVSFTGIFRGQSETSGDCWAIERDDNSTGVAQNGWWNWYKSHGIEEVKDTANSFCGIDIGTTDYSTETLEYNVFDGNCISITPIIQPKFSESALENAKQLEECVPFNHLITNKHMSIKNKIKMLMTGEPEKTLIKHGILTIDKELTSEGKQLFNDFVEKKFKDEFLKELYEVLKDEKVDDKLED